MPKTIYPVARPAQVILVLAVLLMSGSCKRVLHAGKPSLPEASQEGNNTLGCLMDGNVWLTQVRHKRTSPVDSDYSGPGEWGTGFGIKAKQEVSSTAHNHLFLRVSKTAGELRPGVYTVSEGFSAEYQLYANGAVKDILRTTASNQGAITFTKVETKATTSRDGRTLRSTILSGTFQFTATSAMTGKTLVVRDGRFDVQTF